MQTQPESLAELARREKLEQAGRGRRVRQPKPSPTPAEVFDRIKLGLNVKVGDLAPLIGITEAGLYRAIREKRIEAVEIGRAKFLTARVAGPLVGMKPESAAA